MHIAAKFSQRSHEENGQSIDLVLLDEQNLMVPIRAGETELFPSRQFEERVGCGLIPLTGPVKLCTRGLKWNLGRMATSSSET